MLQFQWLPLGKEIEANFKIVKKLNLPFAFIITKNRPAVAAVIQAPEREINCLMSLRDMQGFENMDEQLRCDWLI